MLKILFFIQLFSFIPHLVTAVNYGSASYLVVMADEPRIGSPFQVNVVTFRGGATTVTASFDSVDSVVTPIRRSVTVSPGDPKTLTLQIPSVLSGQYRLSVSGTGGVQFYHAINSIQVSKKDVSAFVQTDKEMYKPGQKVNFRIITVKPNLRPYTDENVNIEIFDPLNNKIKKWEKVPNNNTGVRTLEFQLSDYPVLGDWEIKVATTNDKITDKFTVAEYVLPKFKAEIDMAKGYYMNTDKFITGNVKVKYTYGESVKGTADLTAKLVQCSGNWEYSQYQVNRKRGGTVTIGEDSLTMPTSTPNNIYIAKKTITLDPSKDMHEFKLPMATLIPNAAFIRNNGRYSYYYDNKIWDCEVEIAVNATDKITGKVQNASTTVNVYDSMVKVEFLPSTPSTYKKGLSLTAFVKVTQPDGSPVVSGTLGKKLNVSVKYSYNDIAKNSTIDVPASGVVPIVVAVPKDRISYIQITVSYERIPGAYAKVTKSINNSYKSKNGQAIQAILQGQSVKSGEIAVFDVSTTANTDSLFYSVFSRGLLLQSGSVSKGGSEFQEAQIQFTTTSMMAPQARLLVWYINDGEMLVDVVKFSVSGAFDNQISLRFSKNRAEPGESIDLDIQTKPNSFVGILAVDQSVLLLKGGNDITQAKVMSDIEKYDKEGNDDYYPGPFRGRRRKRSLCFGCWDWWGGKDTNDTLEKANVRVFTDAQVYEEPDYPYIALGFDGAIPMRLRPEGFDIMANSNRPDLSLLDIDKAVEKSQPRVRNQFPETWLFNTFFIRYTTSLLSTSIANGILGFVF